MPFLAAGKRDHLARLGEGGGGGLSLTGNAHLNDFFFLWMSSLRAFHKNKLFKKKLSATHHYQPGGYLEGIQKYFVF